ncbi:hypothetical protein G5B40_16625 [Pikeienuella piscinae]|uniref:Uncharacterized protein n=1 Tax=Pikeienuella piscinae TaxID=2748098 RepID=A0A7L5C4Q8_9RHOB|nr:hypothetical protein [Pikeienuella piscinae]QIE56919.1 hypothetical protein G5B40_16625 [Pikeienuella piscinae]
MNPGDLVEINTEAGRGYVLVTHLHPAYPEALRVYSGLHVARPAKLAEATAAPFSIVLFPLSAAMLDGELAGEVVDRLPVPAAERAYPLFRTPIRDRNGDAIYWWLWDGDAITPAEEGRDIAHLPVREVVGVETLLGLLAGRS